ncbi:hypothetical protein ACOME3_002940 [Neoechinorhynchus agilis]
MSQTFVSLTRVMDKLAQASLTATRDIGNKGLDFLQNSTIPAKMTEAIEYAGERLSEVRSQASQHSKSLEALKVRSLDAANELKDAVKHATEDIYQKCNDIIPHKKSSNEDKSNHLLDIGTKLKTFKTNIFREYKVGKTQRYKLTLIAYSDPILQEGVFAPLKASMNQPSIKGIKSIAVEISFKNTYIAKPVYPKLDKNVVLERAIKAINTNEAILYDSIGFVNYCLTGQKGVLVLIDPKNLSSKGLSNLGIPSTVVSNIIETGATIGVLAVGKAAIAAGSL